MSDHNDYDGITYRDEKNGTPAIFRILMGGLIIWGCIFMGYYLFSGWSSYQEVMDKKKAAESRKQASMAASEATAAKGKAHPEGVVGGYIAKGKQVYANLCVACHGENGKGSVGPDLTVSKYKYGKGRAEIARSIGEGRPGGMPAFNSQISHEEIEALTEYLLSLK